MNIQLWKKHTGRRPTWLGWLLIATLLIGLFAATLHSLYPFLAPNSPPHKGLLVVEGWIHDFALDEAVQLYRQGEYEKIVCTGIPIETGSYIQAFKSYSEMTAARLIKLGIPRDEIVTAIGEATRKDRTYVSATALRKTLMAYNIEERNIHLVTVGPHGRRSRLLFQMALGKRYDIGVTCLEDTEYKPEEWYKYSPGVRHVIGELIAYTYARFFFQP